MIEKHYVKHIVKDGARFHVTRYILYKGKVYTTCSEPNCGQNREWDQVKEPTS